MEADNEKQIGYTKISIRHFKQPKKNNNRYNYMVEIEYKYTTICTFWIFKYKFMNNTYSFYNHDNEYIGQAFGPWTTIIEC